MLGINWPRAYNVTSGHGAVRVDQSRRPPRTARLSVVPNSSYGAQLSLDGVNEYPFLGTTLTEGAAIPKVDQQIIDTLRTIVADGFNAFRIGSSTNKYFTESGFNWGVWKYAETDPDYAKRWEMEETALVQLDKTIAWALDFGIEMIHISLEGFDDIVNRHPNQRPQGTYQGRGLVFSSEYDQMAWDVNSRIFKRVSTITGVRHCDNGRLLWGFDNEHSFSDSLQRTSTASWGGGGAVTWLYKVINSVTDSFGANGYWRTELAAKWVAWLAANAPGYSPPGAWNGCIPDSPTFNALSLNSTDRNMVVDFCSDMDVEHVRRTIDYAQAERADVALMLGTWSYSSPLAWTTHGRTGNFVVDTHNYFSDDTGAGVKIGSVVTRRSAFNSSWNSVTNGMAMADNMQGNRTASVAFIASEESQYGPNGWRYERAAYAALMSCRLRHSVSIVGWAQQVITSQHLLTDGRGMPGDHINVSSQCDRLMSRCVAPIIRHRFFSPMSATYTIMATPQSIRNLEHTQGTSGFVSVRLNPNGTFDGTENSALADKLMVLSVSPSNIPTTDWSASPKISDATLAAGTYVINTAGEKIHVRHNHGVQAMSPYCNWFIGEMLASPVFSMPLSISNLAAAITRAHLCLRSDGPWRLFEGPWMIFVHGSDYSLDLVRRGSDYTLDGPGNVTEAGWLSNSDQQTLYYTASNSQTWSNGTTADQRLMMPESFTVAMDSSAATSPFASLEQEVFKVGNDGLPVRVSTSFGSGITSFAYDATCPVYYGQPLAKRTTGARGRGRR